MNKLDITKLAVRTVAGIGVGKIVTDVISNNTNEPDKAITKITTVVGAAVLGMMVKDASKAYVDTKIDEIATAFREAKQKSKEAKNEEALTSDADPS